jgi:hypothetical protein
MDAVLFHEKQRFRQGWLWLLVVLPLLTIVPLMLFGLHQQLVLEKPFGTNPMNDRRLVVTSLLAMAVPLFVVILFWWSELDVQVTRNEVRARFRPFHLSTRTFPLSEIRGCEARDYEPIGEFGGWGIRMGGSRSWAYNVSGSRGVQLELADGRRLLLGSQRADELAAAILSGQRQNDTATP